jgi:uncharacterized membrane protein
MNEVIRIQKKVHVSTNLPITVYIFSKEQLNSYIETNRLTSVFSWLFNIFLDIAIGAWFSLKQTGADAQTSLMLQTVFWTSLVLSPLLGIVAAWFKLKHWKIEKEITTHQITK